MILLSPLLIAAQVSPGDVSDWIQWVEKYGPWGVFGLIVVGLIVLFAKKYVEGVYAKSLKCLNDLKANVEAIKSVTDELKALEDEDRGAFRACVASLEIMSSEEHWHHCPIERCPNLTEISTRLDKLMDELQDFVREARASRDQTNSQIQALFNVIKDLTHEIIAALRSRRNGHK